MNLRTQDTVSIGLAPLPAANQTQSTLSELSCRHDCAILQDYRKRWQCKQHFVLRVVVWSVVLTFRFKIFLFFFFFFSALAGANECAAGMCANLLAALLRTNGVTPNYGARASATVSVSDEAKKKKKKIEVHT
jgi:hypothetical protein